MKSRVLIVSVLSIVYLSPWWHGYSLECLVNHLFVSMVRRVLIVGVLSIVYLHHGVMDSVLSIVYLSPWCQGYSFGVSCHCLFTSMMSRLLIGSVENWAISMSIHNIWPSIREFVASSDGSGVQCLLVYTNH